MNAHFSFKFYIIRAVPMSLQSSPPKYSICLVFLYLKWLLCHFITQFSATLCHDFSSSKPACLNCWAHLEFEKHILVIATKWLFPCEHFLDLKTAALVGLANQQTIVFSEGKLIFLEVNQWGSCLSAFSSATSTQSLLSFFFSEQDTFWSKSLDIFWQCTELMVQQLFKSEVSNLGNF